MIRKPSSGRLPYSAYNSFVLPPISSKRGLQSGLGAAVSPEEAMLPDDSSSQAHHGQSQHQRLISCETSPAYMTLGWEGGEHSSFHYSWLLDNCTCPDCRTASGQKLSVNARHRVTSPQPPVVTFEEDGKRVRVRWGEKHANVRADVHESVFDAAWLDANCYSRPERVATRRTALAPTTWDSELQAALPVVDYADMAKTDAGLLECARHLQHHGLVFVRNTPVDDESVVRVAERFGSLRDTFYGRTWDVASVPQAVNIAYTSVELGFHQDLFYFESPPGLQLLHCVEYSLREGGASLFMDGFKAVEVLRAEAPDAYDTLASVPVTYHYRHGRQRRHFRRTIIDGRRGANVMDQHVGLYFSPQFEGPLDVPFDQVDRFYDAYRRLLEITQRPELHVGTLMLPGDLVIFNNRRLLHARTGFDASTGRRRLRGCYVDLDDYMSTLRDLEERSANGTLDVADAS